MNLSHLRKHVSHFRNNNFKRDIKKELGVMLCYKNTEKNTTKPNNHDYTVIGKSKDF